MALSDAFEGWALDQRLSPEQSSRLIGMSERLREFADEVGPSWNPPAPKQLPLLAFVARKLLDE
jgi:hypothetical protein